MEQEESNNLNLGALGSFDFTPDWAKKDAGVSVGRIRPERDGDRKPAEGRKSFGERRPSGERSAAGERKGLAGGRKPFGERRPFVERPRPLEVDVKVLPDTKALGTIIRKLQGDHHAYKLKDLAYFFLDNPASVLLKITGRAPRAEQAQQPAQKFFQCKACGFAAMSRDEVVSHVLAVHLADYYDAKEIDCEPPKGNFSCVAKCGLSGVLLGPPNIHEFNAVVKEMVRTRYPEMSEEQYRSHIVMVREAEAIEEWRKGAVKKTVYFAKGEADKDGAAQYTREQVEGEFRRNILDSLVEQPKHLMISAELALKSPVKPLVWAVRDAIERERRAPYEMCFALRGAFHHRKLGFFRANEPRGQEFVSSVEYKPFDAEHAIPELAAVAKFVAEHPCSTREEIAALDPEAEKQLMWLVSTGHVVAFTNGVFSPVEKFPKYGPQWRKKAEVSEKAEAVKPADETVTEEPKKEETKDENSAQLA